MKSFLFPVILLLSAAVGAQTPTADDRDQTIAQERARIAAEREQLKQSLLVQERACYQRFAVNDCLHTARRAQREAKAQLHQQEVLLNDEERQRKASERLQRQEAKKPQPDAAAKP